MKSRWGKEESRREEEAYQPDTPAEHSVIAIGQRFHIVNENRRVGILLCPVARYLYGGIYRRIMTFQTKLIGADVKQAVPKVDNILAGVEIILRDIVAIGRLKSNKPLTKRSYRHNYVTQTPTFIFSVVTVD